MVPNRRSLLTGAAALPALAIPAAADSDDADIEALWIERVSIAAKTRALAASEDYSHDIISRLCKIDLAIAEAAPSPTKAAALFMIRLIENSSLSDRLDERTEMGLIARYLLPTLRPHLAGVIAYHIEDLIRHPSKTLRKREFCEA